MYKLFEGYVWLVKVEKVRVGYCILGRLMYLFDIRFLVLLFGLVLWKGILCCKWECNLVKFFDDIGV